VPQRRVLTSRIRVCGGPRSAQATGRLNQLLLIFSTFPSFAPSKTMSSTPHSLEAADVKEMNDTKQIEISGELTWTPEEEKKLVRKIDTFLLPTMWLMYLLSYMDRTK
jgi:hypothetical protein